MAARAKRKWWQKKTNWAAILTAIGGGLAAYPPTSVIGIVVLGIAGGFAEIAIADRAGKPNEAVTNRTRTKKPIITDGNTIDNDENNNTSVDTGE